MTIEEIPSPTPRNTIQNLLARLIRKKSQHISSLSKNKRRSEQEEYDKNRLINTKNMIKSAFDRHTCNISINKARNNSDHLYPLVLNTPALVLEEITRQAASLFAHDGHNWKSQPIGWNTSKRSPTATIACKTSAIKSQKTTLKPPIALAAQIKRLDHALSP
jgi:hypothetical protein